MILLKMCLDIIMGIFEYMLSISREASFYVRVLGFLLRLVLIMWYSFY